MRFRKILIGVALALGIAAAAVLLFLAGDHDEGIFNDVPSPVRSH
jgi:hypothetical protein